MAKISQRSAFPGESDPLWYKDAIIYEVHVRAFADSSADGIGDFRGLTSKLDYLQDLGVTALWLLPFYPSPGRDDGYDIADYTNVHPAYGNLHDFQAFLREAHRRGLRVITELVLNHTSDQHPWFQRARRAAPGDRARDFYVWSETADKYGEARIIFKDFEASNWTWDPAARAYYWHRFYWHQPDLNFDNPRVRAAVMKALDFWMDLGVDGLRLDAVPYLFEREGANCENLPETHAFLKELRAHIDAKYSDRLLLAEANQWPEDAAAYFGEGDECHMAFHFPLMPRLFMAARMEDRFPILDILHQTPRIPESCQWALFLRNHDELTLEMVTDEERDYMYRVYASDPQMRINLGIRRRLAPLLGNHRRRIELMMTLLLSLPGTPVLYYGDEIGMGDNIYLGDRNGVRTPMHWSADRNAGFSRANPQRLYLPVNIDPEYHFEAVNVEAQQNNPHSLLWWTKHLLALRKQSRPLCRGSLEFLHPDNHRVLAFLRRHEQQRVLVVANLSRFAQPLELDLSAFLGMVPWELSGRVEFPPIGDQPYFMSLAPQGCYWFSLEPAPAISVAAREEELPVLAVTALDHPWDARARAGLERLLPAYIKNRRWFRSKARIIRSAEVVDVIPLAPASGCLVLVRLEYNEGEPEIYVLALAAASGEKAAELLREAPQSAVARLRTRDDKDGLLYGAAWDRGFRQNLLDTIGRRRRLRGSAGALVGSTTRLFRRLRGEGPLPASRLLRGEQSNSSVIYEDRFILKLFRRLEDGPNPDLEIGRYLTEKAMFPHTPGVAGALEYVPDSGPPMTVALLQQFVPNQGDAWEFTIDSLGRYFERVLAQTEGQKQAPPLDRPPLELADEEAPPLAEHWIGSYLEDTRLLGQRTAELHLALVGEKDDPVFAPQPFTDFYRHALYHGMLGLVNRSFQLLRQRLRHLPAGLQPEARRVLEREDEIRQRFRPIRDRRVTAMRFRHHGDYHLGQVLFTGKDFVIIDFEGEPARPLSERRLPRSPLRDVAGMLRSFHYAASAVLFGQVPGVIVRPEASEVLLSWADFWCGCVSSAFLRGYLVTARKAPFLPQGREELRILLDAYLLEKAVYEVGYELNNRPDWVRIPLQGILDILGTGG